MKRSQENAEEYVLCYVVGNLLRQILLTRNAALPQGETIEAGQRRGQDTRLKGRTNTAIQIRKDESDVFYLDYKFLAFVIDCIMKLIDSDRLEADSDALVLIRNAIMHTAWLTDDAKTSLEGTTNNFKAKIRSLLEALSANG